MVREIVLADCDNIFKEARPASPQSVVEILRRVESLQAGFTMKDAFEHLGLTDAAPTIIGGDPKMEETICEAVIEEPFRIQVSARDEGFHHLESVHVIQVDGDRRKTLSPVWHRSTPGQHLRKVYQSRGGRTVIKLPNETLEEAVGRYLEDIEPSSVDQPDTK